MRLATLNVGGGKCYWCGNAGSDTCRFIIRLRVTIGMVFFICGCHLGDSNRASSQPIDVATSVAPDMSDPVIATEPHPLIFPSAADKVIAGLSTHGAQNLDELCAEPGTDGLTSTGALCAT